MSVSKYETKMRKSLGQLATSFLLWHLYRKDRDQWADFYTPDTQSFLKGTGSPARRKMRLSLAPFMDMRIKRNTQGRQQYSCRITEENLAAIIEKFGVVADHEGKPFEPKVDQKEDLNLAGFFNPQSVGQPLDNLYTADEERQRRAAKQRQAEKEQEAEVKEQKEHQREADRAAMKRLKEFGISGVSVEQIQEVI